jgi:uncharacterized protein (TIGR00251 family)
VSDATPVFWRADGDALILTVRVQPGARTDALTGIEGGALRVRLKAPAIEGRANEALRIFLAACFRTSKTRVEIVRGEAGRLKQVRITGARVAPESLLS